MQNFANKYRLGASVIALCKLLETYCPDKAKKEPSWKVSEVLRLDDWKGEHPQAVVWSTKERNCRKKPTTFRKIYCLIIDKGLCI